MSKACFRSLVLLSLGLVSACTVQNSDIPGLSGPSEGTGPLQAPVVTPTARFSFSPSAPPANSPVQFDGTASCVGPADPNAVTPCGTASGAITAYNWNFGDGTGASGPVASHAYGVAGTYGVTLTVVNSSGRSSPPTSHAVPVAVGLGPTANFTISPTDPEPHYSVVFNGQTSTPGTGHTIRAWNWDFGDVFPLPPGVPPQATTGLVVTHQFFAPGTTTYTIVLTVVDEAGQSSSTTKTLTVKPKS